MQSKSKMPGTVILILDKIGFETKLVPRNKKGHFIKI